MGHSRQEADRRGRLSPELLAWRQWLLGRRPQPASSLLLPAPERLAEGNASEHLRADLRLVDWLFPADSCRVSADSPFVEPSDIQELLQGQDERLRVYYVGFLSLLGATVDWHGWVMDWRIEEPGGLRLPTLGAEGIAAVARVLRFLQVAGWRGYSDDGYRDPQDFWYDKAFYRWLQATWHAQAHQGEPFPSEWREALRNTYEPQPGLPPVASRDVARLLQRCQRRVHQFRDLAQGPQLGESDESPVRRGPPPVNRLL